MKLSEQGHFMSEALNNVVNFPFQPKIFPPQAEERTAVSPMPPKTPTAGKAASPKKPETSHELKKRAIEGLGAQELLKMFSDQIESLKEVNKRLRYYSEEIEAYLPQKD